MRTWVRRLGWWVRERLQEVAVWLLYRLDPDVWLLYRLDPEPKRRDES